MTLKFCDFQFLPISNVFVEAIQENIAIFQYCQYYVKLYCVHLTSLFILDVTCRIYINYKKAFELVLTGDNTKDSKENNMEKYRKYKNTIFLLKMLTSAKNSTVNISFKYFLNCIKYLVSVPIFKCLAFSHQK